MTQPEKKVKDAIKRKMQKLFPRLWGYMPVQTGFGQHGIPDHLFCVPMTVTPDMVGKEIGVFVAIEAKTETGKLSKYQEIQIRQIAEAGGFVDVVYGKDESLDRALDRLQEELQL